MTTQNALNTAQFPSTAGSSGNLIRSNGTKYTNTTLTFPDTSTANQLLYSSSTNTIGGLATAANGVLVTDGSSVPSISSTLPSAVQGNITAVGTVASGTWNGSVIGLAYGGTSKNLTASNGGVVYTDADSMEVLTATATARQMLQSGASTAPAWSTTTWPATSSINQILYSSAANVISEITGANQGVLCTNGTGVPAYVTMSAGRVLVGTTSGAPSSSLIASGTGILVSSVSGSITIATAGGGMSWNTVSGTSQTAVIGNGYITDNAGLVTVTLPATFVLGAMVRIVGLGAGGWRLAAGASDIIRYGSSVTSAGGSLSSTNQYDTVTVVGMVANTTWTVIESVSTGLTVA